MFSTFEVFSDDFIRDLPMSIVMKKWRLVGIWWTYWQEKACSGTFQAASQP